MWHQSRVNCDDCSLMACSRQPKQPVSLTMCTSVYVSLQHEQVCVCVCFLLRVSRDAVGLMESMYCSARSLWWLPFPCVTKQTGWSLAYLCVSVPQTVISDLTERVFINFCQSQVQQLEVPSLFSQDPTLCKGTINQDHAAFIQWGRWNIAALPQLTSAF